MSSIQHKRYACYARAFSISNLINKLVNNKGLGVDLINEVLEELRKTEDFSQTKGIQQEYIRYRQNSGYRSRKNNI